MSRRVNLVLFGLMAAASGAYLLIYLVRWEWHRAIIAGLFFLAAEIALVAGVVLSRLRGIERRLEQLADTRQPGSPAPEIRARLRETAPSARAPFAWLKSDKDLNVFLPVLLGAGLVASAAAWLVESVARATARPVLERDLALRLVPASWPSGGLLDRKGGDAPALHRHRFRRLKASLAVAVLLAGGGFGYDALADAFQTRPEIAQQGVRTQIDVRFSGSRIAGDPERMAGDLWASCKLTLSRPLPAPIVLPLDHRQARLVVDADLGRHAATRIRGCFEDAVLDHLQARVISVTRLEVS